MRTLSSTLASLIIAACGVRADDLPTPRFEPVTIGKIEKGYGLCIADVDGDGKKDILLADRWDFVWFRNGDWKRFPLASRLDGQGAMSIDARDVDGDGNVEIAVCTRGPESAVYFLKRPADFTQPWTPIRLPSEPEQHRIKWAQEPSGKNYLISVPIVGRNNHLRTPTLPVDDPVKVYGYEYTPDVETKPQRRLLVDTLRDMHNFAVIPGKTGERVFFIGIEGVDLMGNAPDKPWTPQGARRFSGMTPPVRRPDKSLHAGIGEIAEGRTAQRTYLATVEPKHGTTVAVYPAYDAGGFGGERQVLDSSLVATHALECRDVLGIGRDQIIAGWWGEEKKGNFGIRMYVPMDARATQWKTISIDEGKMACQSLQIVDMDGDGRLDLVAAGWTTENLVIYWNRTAPAPGPRLLGHWTFDGISERTVRDASGNGRDGMIHGGPESVPGISGEALRFRAVGDYVDFRQPVIPPGDFTIGVWINCDDVEKQFFLGQYRYAHPRRLDLAVREGAMRIQLNETIDSAKVIQPRRWYHVVYTRAGDVGRIYLDGELLQTGKLPTDAMQDEGLMLGKIVVPKQDSFRFTGCLDELKIWQGALAATEISQMFLDRRKSAAE